MTIMKNTILNFVTYNGDEAVAFKLFTIFQLGIQKFWYERDSFLIESSNVISPLKNDSVHIAKHAQKPLSDTLAEDFVISQ